MSDTTFGQDGIIETASATTSPDNASSGPLAYIITAATLVLSIALMWGVGRLVASAASAVGSDGRIVRYLDDGFDDYDDHDDGYDFDDMDIDELERFFFE